MGWTQVRMTCCWVSSWFPSMSWWPASAWSSSCHWCSRFPCPTSSRRCGRRRGPAGRSWWSSCCPCWPDRRQPLISSCPHPQWPSGLNSLNQRKIITSCVLIRFSILYNILTLLNVLIKSVYCLVTIQSSFLTHAGKKCNFGINSNLLYFIILYNTLFFTWLSRQDETMYLVV